MMDVKLKKQVVILEEKDKKSGETKYKMVELKNQEPISEWVEISKEEKEELENDIS